jgi:hypothetical protein
VALDPNTYEVVGHSKSLRVAENSAVKKGVSRPLMLPVPKSNAYFVGRAGSTDD